MYDLYNLLHSRNIARLDMDGNENQLTFGQIVPIFLLMSTLVTFKEAYDGKRWIVGTHERSQPELISLSIRCSQGPERVFWSQGAILP